MGSSSPVAIIVWRPSQMRRCVKIQYNPIQECRWNRSRTRTRTVRSRVGREKRNTLFSKPYLFFSTLSTLSTYLSLRRWARILDRKDRAVNIVELRGKGGGIRNSRATPKRTPGGTQQRRSVRGGAPPWAGRGEAQARAWQGRTRTWQGAAGRAWRIPTPEWAYSTWRAWCGRVGGCPPTRRRPAASHHDGPPRMTQLQNAPAGELALAEGGAGTAWGGLKPGGAAELAP